MDKLLNIKNRKLAIILGVNWIVDLIIGLILYRVLGKINLIFLESTMLVDTIFLITVYLFEYYKKDARYDIILKGFIMFRNIFLIFYYMEYFCGKIKNVNPLDVRFWLNGLIYITALVFLFAIFYRLPVTAIAFNSIAFILLITNLFLVDERGLPFFFADLFSIGTAAEVASNYTFSEWPQYLCIFIWFLTGTVTTVFVLKMQTKTKPEKLRWNILIRVSSLGFVFAVLTLFLKTPLMAEANIEPYFWKHTKNGVALNLMMDAKYSQLEKPSEYKESLLQDVASKYKGREQSSEITPNILVIMDESFADLSVFGEFETNIDVMPFIASMKENTIKGHVFSSVYGGSTADSEYEFLTGDSMISYPNGAVAYQTYLKGETYVSSLVRNIQKSGYETISFHPNKATNWNRNSIYKALNFNYSMWIEDVQNPEYLRDYITDKCDFENVISKFESKGDKPLFLFNITMQNHGGYLISPFDNEVKVTSGEEGAYPKTEQYLTVAHKTDEAVKELIEYFENYEEPTMIVFFGDHHPKIDSNFIEDMLGGSMDDLEIEELQKLYQTPFFIWANYDIEEKENVDISLNYLSTLMCHTAGLPTTPYQEYLAELSKKFPVVNGNGVVDSEGNYYTKTEALKKFEELKIYECLIYNHMYDKSGYLASFFEIR